jgi:hypothetical protein
MKLAKGMRQFHAQIATSGLIASDRDRQEGLYARYPQETTCLVALKLLAVRFDGEYPQPGYGQEVAATQAAVRTATAVLDNPAELFKQCHRMYDLMTQTNYSRAVRPAAMLFLHRD